MALDTFDVGDLVRVGNHSGGDRAVFANVSGVTTDPTTVTLTLKRPDDTRLVYGWPLTGADGLLTKDATGRFYRDVLQDQAGRWRWRLEGTGAVQTAEEGAWYVRASRVLT